MMSKEHEDPEDRKRFMIEALTRMSYRWNPADDAVRLSEAEREALSEIVKTCKSKDDAALAMNEKEHLFYLDIGERMQLVLSERMLGEITDEKLKAKLAALKAERDSHQRTEGE
jgi:hypothetical protein